MTNKLNLKKGFTLIELLIVIAILGVLAVVVLVAINPVEQLARTRDAGRISSVTQIGHALQAYYTTQNATFPPDTSVAAWTGPLTTSGELSNIPSGVAYSVAGTAACSENAAGTPGTWCYDTDTTNGSIVYARLESGSNNAKCPVASPRAWISYSTADGRGGVVCTTAATTALDPWAAGGQTYY